MLQPCPGRSTVSLHLSRSRRQCQLNSRPSERSPLRRCLPFSQSRGPTACRSIQRSQDFECRFPANTQMLEALLPTPLQKTQEPQAPLPDELALMHLIHQASSCPLLRRARTHYSVQAPLDHPIPLLDHHHRRIATRMAAATTWRRPFQHCLVDLLRMAFFPHPRAFTLSGALGVATPTCYRVR